MNITRRTDYQYECIGIMAKDPRLATSAFNTRSPAIVYLPAYKAGHPAFLREISEKCSFLQRRRPKGISLYTYFS
ncbi:MAG: hypothetical protein C0392_04270 [Syntrophus sp. (in: bacteria)]|nr:hypothetical protein [Syntrophus sp. (in: bacteria)]